MEPLPALDIPDWKVVENPDGTTTVSMNDVRKLLVVIATLRQYIDDQLTRCAVDKPQ